MLSVSHPASYKSNVESLNKIGNSPSAKKYCLNVCLLIDMNSRSRRRRLLLRHSNHNTMMSLSRELSLDPTSLVSFCPEQPVSIMSRLSTLEFSIFSLSVSWYLIVIFQKRLWSHCHRLHLPGPCQDIARCRCRKHLNTTTWLGSVEPKPPDDTHHHFFDRDVTAMEQKRFDIDRPSETISYPFAVIAEGLRMDHQTRLMDICVQFWIMDGICDACAKLHRSWQLTTFPLGFSIRSAYEGSHRSVSQERSTSYRYWWYFPYTHHQNDESIECEACWRASLRSCTLRPRESKQRVWLLREVPP